MKNINKVLGIVLVLLLCASVGFGQTELKVQVINSTTEDYECSAQFTEACIPTNVPVYFEVPAENMVEITFIFDEDDISLEKLKCYYPPNTPNPNPVIIINTYSGPMNVAPYLGIYPNQYFNQFSYQGSGNIGGIDIYYFRIDPN
ncbi:MAG: hypothetical protein HN704_11900 [Bacteroidetes bacterium]|jgi:hypothetical protein|nr:hypothetical protein [Bacteroidota bacterium]MBT6685584.1 hypothetical protein [Bacteroidota bacterium]MBT7144472.1 hypothetical protein [Bacteroidota bacterium]MBT7492294.1 hypothetical protein [Bacteroidota bacterium]